MLADIPHRKSQILCIRRFLSQALQEIFDAARFRAKLLRSHGLWQRFKSYVEVIAKQTILKFSGVVNITGMILKEREMIEYVQGNSIPVHFTTEGYIAGALALCILILTIKILFF
jgi:hypothetical protein